VCKISDRKWNSNDQSRKIFVNGARGSANRFALIRSFLIDSELCDPRARRIVQNIFALHLHRIVSTAVQNFARMRAIYICVRRRRRTLAVARSPYSIGVFATCAQCAHNLAQHLFTMMSRAPCASLRARVMRNARRIHTLFSGVSDFFIAL
jgi:hypothetical protein